MDYPLPPNLISWSCTTGKSYGVPVGSTCSGLIDSSDPTIKLSAYDENGKMLFNFSVNASTGTISTPSISPAITTTDGESAVYGIAYSAGVFTIVLLGYCAPGDGGCPVGPGQISSS